MLNTAKEVSSNDLKFKIIIKLIDNLISYSFHLSIF